MTHWLGAINLICIVVNVVMLIKLRRKNNAAAELLNECAANLDESRERLEEAGDNREQARAAVRSARLRAGATS